MFFPRLGFGDNGAPTIVNLTADHGVDAGTVTFSDPAL
jgi:hypothetical protein